MYSVYATNMITGEQSVEYTTFNKRDARKWVIKNLVLHTIAGYSLRIEKCPTQRQETRNFQYA